MPHPQKGKELAITERRAEAARLTHKGWSTRRIAEHLGCSHATIANDVNALLSELVEHQIKDAEKIRARELEKLALAESAVIEVLERSSEEDADMVLKATDRIARLQERRAKLLGLDAPERIDATVSEGPTPETAARLVREEFGESDNGSGRQGTATAAADADDRPVSGDAGEVSPGTSGA
jgi:transposase